MTVESAIQLAAVDQTPPEKGTMHKDSRTGKAQMTFTQKR